MVHDNPPKDPPTNGKLISSMEEFLCFGQWHSGWTVLEEANPGLAFAVALLLPLRTDGLKEISDDLDRCLSAGTADLLRKTGLPVGEKTMRILERFDRHSWRWPFEDSPLEWWHSPGQPSTGDRERTALRILCQLLMFEPDASEFFLSRKSVTLDDVVKLATGLGEEESSWVCSVLFRAEHIARAEWFFRLPFVRRCSLARTFWELHGAHVGDFVTERVEREAFPHRPHMDAFRGEAHAKAYSVRFHKRREQVRQGCFEEARLSPWPKHVVPGSGTIVPVRNLGEAYPESCRMEFMTFDPKNTLRIPAGQICLYRMLRPLRALVVLEFSQQNSAVPRWELRCLITWLDQPEARLKAAEKQVERWLDRQPEELRERPVASSLGNLMIGSAQSMG